jgi:hypothetical protein
MRDEHGDLPQRVSRRDVAAAWICCALAAVAGALVIAAANADGSRREAYAGVYLPGRDVVKALDRRDDGADDQAEWAEGPAQNQARPLLCKALENPRYAAAEKSPSSTTPPLKC